MKRLFVGLKFSPHILKKLEPSIKKIKRMSDQKEIEARWTSLDNLHLTLLFLGESDQARIQEIRTTLQTLSKKVSQFEIRIEGVGAFPEASNARVLWMGVRQSRDLMALQAEVVTALQALSSDYRPHITIAKLRNLKNIWDIVKPFAKESWGKSTAEEIILFESIQAGPLPIYSQLEKYPLQVQITD